MRKLTRDYLERKSMRILGRNVHRSKSTVMKIIHQVCASLKSSVWVAKRFQPKWSGILVVDGKGVKVFDRLVKHIDTSKFSSLEIKRLHRQVWICGVDVGTGDLPHYCLAEEETKIDLVLFFRCLKDEIRYGLRVLVCDGNDDIVQAARKVYGNTFLVQRCVRHYVEGLGYRAGRLGASEHPRTEELVEDLRHVIVASTFESALRRLTRLKRKRFTHEAHKQMLEDFYEHFTELTTYLQYPHLNIPKTNNDAETLFRQLNIRLKTVCRLGSFKTSHNYLNAWALMRRFTPFTDCRGKRKSRNKKSPLELAGCDIQGYDYLNL